MPDKRIDEQFVNQAWEQMLATLDREMPVEEKRRRIIFVPWRLAAAASILLLLTIGAGWWLSQRSALSTQPMTDSSPAISTQPEANAMNAQDAAIATTGTAKTKALSQNESLQNQQNAGLAAQSNAGSKTPILTKRNKVATDKNNVESATVQAIQQIAGIKSNGKETLPSEVDLIPENVAIASTENTTSPNLQNQPLQALNAQQIAMLEKETVKIEERKKLEFFGETSEEKKAKSNKWNIGLELATYSSAGAALDGYAGGAVVDVPVESEKFNLRTGLNFNSQQRYFDSNVPVTAADQGSNPGFGSTAVVVDPSPDLQVNAQQLSFPLTLEFKPRKSWGLEGGLQASYLLGARNLKGAEAYQTVAGFTNGNADIRTFVKSLSNEAFDVTSNADPMIDNSTVNIDAFRRFDVALTAGFGYYPTTNIGVRLQYQRGLIDIIKADQFKTFGSNVRLSAVYFFGK